MKLLKKAVATALAMLMLTACSGGGGGGAGGGTPVAPVTPSAFSNKRIRLHRAEKARTCMLNIMEQKTTRAARWCRIRVC